MKHLKAKPRSQVLLYLLLVVAVIGLMLSLRKCRKGLDMPVDQGGDTLRVAMQYAPGSFFMDGDTLAGRDYEALKKLDIPYKIFPITNPAEGLKGLREHQYDLVIADLPQTADSASEYIFTEPVYLDRQVLVQRVDSIDSVPPISSPLQLVGKTICVPQGSPMVSRLQNLEREIGGNINLIQRDATSERLLIELALGADSVNLVVCNASIAEELARDYPQLNFSVPVSLTQFQPWILRKDEISLKNLIDSKLKNAQ